MPNPKKAVRVETHPLIYCPSCFLGTARGDDRLSPDDRFCPACGAALARRLVRVVACECAPNRGLMTTIADSYKIPDPRVAALTPDRFCPSCGTSIEKLLAEWEALQVAAVPGA